MGILIAIEGTDSSGKQTQSEMLYKALCEKGFRARLVSFPAYECDSSALVKMYLAGEFGTDPKDVNAYTASTFYAMDRFATYRKDWGKDYNDGIIIVADRYVPSNLIHQASKIENETEKDAFIKWLEDLEYIKYELPRPDATIFLDMPVEISQKLLMKRYEGDSAKKDVHERDVEYLKACHKAAAYASRKLNWNVILCGENGEPFSFEYISILRRCYRCKCLRISAGIQ